MDDGAAQYTVETCRERILAAGSAARSSGPEYPHPKWTRAGPGAMIPAPFQGPVTRP
jgi:hypothetical protein